MKLLCFAVYDAKAEAYLRPFFAETKGLAMRSFSDAVNDPAHEMCRHAEDYTLFHIGVFNQESASWTELKAPDSLAKAITLKRVVE